MDNSSQANINELPNNESSANKSQTNISNIAISGGVSANSLLRSTLNQLAKQSGWQVFIPKFEYCTDNAAMIAITGYYKYLKQDFTTQAITPLPRYALD